MASNDFETGVDLGEEIEEGLLLLRTQLMSRLDSLGVNLCGLHIDISGELNDLERSVNALAMSVGAGIGI